MSAIDLQSFQSLARARRSIRKFLPETMDGGLLHALLEAARWAPSPHNRQPWKFVVLESAETRASLAGAMGERLRADRLADGDDPQAVEADVARSQARISGAAAAVLLCLTMQGMQRYPDERRAQAERLMAAQGVAMAGQNLLLAAHAAGLGACWICAPLFAPETVRRILQLPQAWDPQGLIVLGWPAVTPAERTRLPLEVVVEYR